MRDKCPKGEGNPPEQIDEQVREIVAHSDSQISFIDHQIGRIMNTLTEEGLDENAIVIYISDHGDRSDDMV